MRTDRIFLALTFALLVSAVPASAANECISIAVTGAPSSNLFADGFESGDTLAWSVPVVPAFSLVNTDDLTAEVTLDAAVTGDHLLELRWSLPGGQLYQSVAVPFTVGAVEAGASRVVPGYPFPVAQVSARRAPGAVAGESVVGSAMPVAGTLIVEAGLSGAWSVEPYLDGSEIACGDARVFRLEP